MLLASDFKFTSDIAHKNRCGIAKEGYLKIKKTQNAGKAHLESPLKGLNKRGSKFSPRN
jgi:hypothetical protein